MKNIINNIINNKYFILFIYFIIFLFFNYISNIAFKKLFNKRESFEQNSDSQKNTISKNINNIEVPSDFMPTHPYTNAKSGLDLIDKPQEHYYYDEKDEKHDNMNDIDFAPRFTCRPSITGVFTDCGPYSFNACPINNNKNSNNSNSDKKDKTRRKHHDDRKKNHNNDNLQTNRRRSHNIREYSDTRDLYDLSRKH